MDTDFDFTTPESDEAREPIVILNPPVPGGGPPCIWCNAPTQRTGMCYTCIACGNTTSC